LAVNDPISSTITLKLADPEGFICGRCHALLEPCSAMPEVTVHEYREPDIFEDEVGCAEDMDIVAPKTKPQSPKSHSQPLLRLGL
jgi:hypothetical protein